MQVSREEFLQEMKLRQLIREHISVVMKEEEEILKEETKLRSIIRNLILEQEAFQPETTAQAAADKALQDTTTQVYNEIDSLKEVEEKQSFQEHFMKYLDDLFNQLDKEEPNKLREQEEINVSLDSKEPTEPVIIPPEDERPSDADLEDEEASIPGKEYEGSDYTGKEYAQRAFKSVENQITNYYKPLTGSTRKEFRNLMLVNYEEYFKNWMSDTAEVAPL
jgi:DNA-binding protein Fis